MSKQSLDDKLFETIWPGLLDGEALDMQQLMRKKRQPIIDAVKKLFAAEGYMTLAEIGTIAKMYFDNKLMTGQEWYDRFVEECKKLHPNNPSIFDPVYDAARIAAGLQETEE